MTVFTRKPRTGDPVPMCTNLSGHQWHADGGGNEYAGRRAVLFSSGTRPRGDYSTATCQHRKVFTRQWAQTGVRELLVFEGLGGKADRATSGCYEPPVGATDKQVDEFLASCEKTLVKES